MSSSVEHHLFTAVQSLTPRLNSAHDPAKVTLWEALFVLFSLGFALDEWAALLENGFSAYSTTSYNVLDGVFVIIFVAFMALRAIGLATGDLDRSELAFDTMSLAGCVLFPRLTISLIRGNVVLLALGEMLVQFCWFMLLASLTASGFLCTLWILARGSPVWDIGHISWLMVSCSGPPGCCSCVLTLIAL